MRLKIHGRSLNVAHDASIVVFLHGFETSFLNPHP
jgi:esterase/lipase superfamily enzyme